MTDKKLVYICSPYAGDIDYNTKMAKEYCRYAMKCECVPIAVHLIYPSFLDDTNPAERAAGIQMGLRVLATCEELWIGGTHISEGMKIEISEAERLGIPVKRISQSELMEVNSIKKYGIWAERSSASIFGAREAWLKRDGKPVTFDTYKEAAHEASRLMNNIGTANVSYCPKEIEVKLEEAPASGMNLKL